MQLHSTRNVVDIVEITLVETSDRITYHCGWCGRLRNNAGVYSRTALADWPLRRTQWRVTSGASVENSDRGLPVLDLRCICSLGQMGCVLVVEHDQPTKGHTRTTNGRE